MLNHGNRFILSCSRKATQKRLADTTLSKLDSMSKHLILAIFLTMSLFRPGHAQWGTSFDFLPTQAQRIDWKSNDASKEFKHGFGIGYALYYSFPERRKNAVDIQRSVGLGLEMVTRAAEYGGETIASNWLRIPLSLRTDIPVRIKGSDQNLFAFTSGIGYHLGLPIAIEQPSIGPFIPRKYSVHGIDADFGFMLYGPFGTRFKLAYRLSADVFSLGAKDALSWSKLKFIEHGFTIGLSRSLASVGEQKRAAKAEKKAKKK